MKIKKNNRPKVLVIVPCTMQGYAGNIIRIMQTIKLLQKDAEVDLLSLVQSNGLHKHLKQKGVEGVNIGIKNQPLLTAILRVTYKVIYKVNRILVEKAVIRTYYSFKLFDIIANFMINLAAPSKYTAIFCNYIWIERGLRSLGQTSIVDLHDLHGNRHQKLMRRDWVNLAIEDEERRIFEVSTIIAISEDEFEKVKQFEQTNVKTFLPYFPDIRTQFTKDCPKVERRCVFVGSNNLVNLDAIKNIESSGLMGILIRANFTLDIIGTICYTDIAKAVKSRYPDNVSLLGVVEDVSNIFSTACIGLNLCGPSTGLKIKTVDYIAAGLSVICTSYGSDTWLAREFADQIYLIDVDKHINERSSFDILNFCKKAINASRNESFRQVSEKAIKQGWIPVRTHISCSLLEENI